MIPRELSLDACGNAIGRTILRLDLKNVSILRPNIEAAPDAAIGANRFGSANARLAHGLLGFRQPHDRSVTGFGLDALDHVDHAVQRRLRQAGHKPGFTHHRGFHQRVAGADRYAMTARDATGFSDRRAPVPQYARMWVFPINRKRFIHLKVLACLDATPAEDALIGIVAIEGIAVVDFVGLGAIGSLLMFNRQQLGGVMDGAVAVVIVAHRAVENVVAENFVEGLSLRRARGNRFRIDVHFG
jgi:hypothetical protein